MRFITATLAIWLFGMISTFAAEGGHVLPLDAQRIHPAIPITSSMLMIWLAVGLIILFCRAATKQMTLVPAGLQNFAEWVVESLYSFLEGMIGSHMIKRTFWFFGSIFFFILVSNWMALIPGVGTVGVEAVYPDGEHRFLPFLRGGNADLNMTAAMAATFAILWFYWALTENGVKGFLSHIFAPKGHFSGIMLAVMIPVFLFVGVLELISIAIRPVALSFRLFGNIYGGEQTLESLMALMPHKALAFLPAFPFYFMELLVGFLQALVFTLLCAIFLKLITDHGDEAHH